METTLHGDGLENELLNPSLEFLIFRRTIQGDWTMTGIHDGI